MLAAAEGVEPGAPSELGGENHKRFGKGSAPFQIIEQVAQCAVEIGSWLHDPTVVVRVRVPTPNDDFLGERKVESERVPGGSMAAVLVAHGADQGDLVHAPR